MQIKAINRPVDYFRNLSALAIRSLYYLLHERAPLLGETLINSEFLQQIDNFEKQKAGRQVLKITPVQVYYGTDGVLVACRDRVKVPWAVLPKWPPFC